MSTELTSVEIIQVLEDFLRATRDDETKELKFSVPGITQLEPFKFPYSTAERVAGVLAGYSVFEETILQNPSSYEVLINDESSLRVGYGLRGEPILKDDPEHGVSYKIGAPSDEYMLFALYRVSRSVPLRMIRRYASPMMNRRLRDLGENVPSGMDAVRMLLPRIRTLKIESKKSLDLQQFAIFANSFLFQLSYNLNLSFVEERSWSEIIRNSRLVAMRRSSIDDIEAPKRRYVADLVFHYQMAVASENPVLQYLSYYHIAEHFFEDVVNEEMLEAVRSRITSPAFSYKRKKDLGDLVTEVKKRLSIRADNLAIKELDALKLVLKKFVSLPELATSLTTFDPKLVEYYRTTEVPFSKGDAIDLTAIDLEVVSARLANRIYKTRNSIVHSKEGEKARYIPFKNDDELGREIPLMRFIGEAITIGSSRVLE